MAQTYSANDVVEAWLKVIEASSEVIHEQTQSLAMYALDRPPEERDIYTHKLLVALRRLGVSKREIDAAWEYLETGKVS